jgi:hypothetical protein
MASKKKPRMPSRICVSHVAGQTLWVGRDGIDGEWARLIAHSVPDNQAAVNLNRSEARHLRNWLDRWLAATAPKQGKGRTSKRGDGTAKGGGT